MAEAQRRRAPADRFSGPTWILAPTQTNGPRPPRPHLGQP